MWPGGTSYNPRSPLMRIGRLRRLLTCALVSLLGAGFVACGRDSPTTPSSIVQVEGPGFATPMSCPSAIRMRSEDGLPLAVTFPFPMVPGFGDVTKSTCAPESGSTFPVGRTEVSCSATAGEEIVSSCAFTVDIVIRTLDVDKFLAFGDSITFGTSSPAPTVFASAGIPTSYPALLQEALIDYYLDPTITVVNAGKPGEQTPEGRRRIGGELNMHRPDVLMILEGINNLLRDDNAQIEQDLESMVRSGRSAGADVLVATLTPAYRGEEVSDEIRDLNSRIRRIAQRNRIDPVVDLFGAFEGRRELIGVDGVHPTLEGFRAIAEEFLDAIARFETESLSSLSAVPLGIPTAIGASEKSPPKTRPGSL